MQDRLANADDVLERMRTLRQARLFDGQPVPAEVLDQLLQIARWTGSGRNTQPWHFIVIDDRNTLQQLSEIRAPINWLADAPIAIGIVLDGKAEINEAYDEGRLAERLMLAAYMLGLGGGIAWFGDDQQQETGKGILGIPTGLTSRGVVALGKPTTTKDHRPNANTGGRKPLDEIVSRNTYSGG